LEDGESNGSSNNLALRILNLVCFVLAIILNGVAASGTLSGKSIGDIADENPSMFTPDSYAFSIWSVIYALTGLGMVYKLLETCCDAFPESVVNDTLYESLRWELPAQWLINGIWCCIFVFDTDTTWVLSMLILLLQVAVNYRIYDVFTKVMGDMNIWEYVFFFLGFALYSGWTISASIANISSGLRRFGFDAWTEEGWTILMGAVAFVLYQAILFRYGVDKAEPVCPLVFSWVAIAIASARYPSISLNHTPGKELSNNNVEKFFVAVGIINLIVCTVFVVRNVGQYYAPRHFGCISSESTATVGNTYGSNSTTNNNNAQPVV